MPFQVPQFIEREPKIVGPFTFRQFVYLAVPSTIGFFLYFLAPFTLFVAGTAVCVFIGLVLGFLKINGRSLPAVLLNLIWFSVRPKTYIWEKRASRGSDSLKQYGQSSEEQQVSSQIKLKKR